MTVTGSRCWGGGQGVSRGGERGDDGHHKDCRGSGDRRHFLQVVLSSRERGQRDTDQNDRLLWVPLPLALGGQDEKERAQRRLAFGSVRRCTGERGNAQERFIQPYFVVELMEPNGTHAGTNKERTALLLAPAAHSRTI
jgi:hypothetical protein